ncbi:MAG TPA: aminodeoxychorismate/anthranilate synthase component II [Flavipsychrobacter sp.]|nr:aminodeoxychorismate/anthranilate synthase component II [Flavipsychrobacter sp.]
MRILIIDNYDSFTYNLVQLIRQTTGKEPIVKRNDQITIQEVAAYDKILLSPGPGIPSEAGLLLEIIKNYAHSKSILGICLGHQAIGEAFGAKLIILKNVFHGVATRIKLAMDDSLFSGLPQYIEAGRYHSWVVSNSNFPSVLKKIAEDDQGNIMAVRHKVYDVTGVQFHPESILTPSGKTIISNWLNS